MAQCPNRKKCGGCQLQNLTYDEQLGLKQSRAIKLLGKYCHVNEIIGMERPLNYRNKAQRAFVFKNGRVLSGIYQSADGRIVPVDSCGLETKTADGIFKTLERLCAQFKLTAYDLKTGKGFVRHALIRQSFSTNEIMAVIVTSKGKFQKKQEFAEALLKRHPEITTIVWNINPTGTPLFLGEESEILYGSGYITDKLCGLDFRIGANSFYQVNPIQTEILYKTAKEYANLTGKETVLDAYCGTGTIGLTMASKAKKIIGVEINPHSISDAIQNAEINGIANASFITGDAGDFIEKCAQNGERFDIVISDPPRSGCSTKFIKNLLKLSPEKVVYISCNPLTLSNDLFLLRKGGYKVKRIQPVDMFPFTNHVECCVLLTKQKGVLSND